jgi:hypothetical protein
LKSGLFCKSANPQDFIIYPQIANPQISAKCGTTLRQNSPQSRLKTHFLCSVLKIEVMRQETKAIVV